MVKEIVLTKLERQLLVFEIISKCKVTEYREITSRIPISKRTIQRDVKDLTDAGLICVEFSKKENGYIHVGPPEFNSSISDEKKKKYLQHLHRLGTLMWHLESNWDDDYEELLKMEMEGEVHLEDWEKEEHFTAVDSYLELFPDCSEEDWNQDFEILTRIDYWVYRTEGGNYYVEEMIFGRGYGDLGDENSGVRMREDGKLVKKEHRCFIS